MIVIYADSDPHRSELVIHLRRNMPLYRQEKIWQRLGIEIPRNTVCGWVMPASEVCMPMGDILIKELKASDYLQADETPLQVMDEPNRKKVTKSYMWVYKNHIPDKKIILFDYRETRQAQWSKEILENFKGYLQTDGYAGYDWVDGHPDISSGVFCPRTQAFCSAGQAGQNHREIPSGLLLWVEKTGCSPEAPEELMPVLFFIALSQPPGPMNLIPLIISKPSLKTSVSAKPIRISLRCCHGTSVPNNSSILP